jgi:hypothetical protein
MPNKSILHEITSKKRYQLLLWCLL